MADALRIEVGSPFDLTAIQAATFTNFAIDAAADTLEYIMQAPAAITITKLGFRYGARTGTPPTYRINLQGVGTTGIPDGTIKGATNNALKTFTPPADATWNSTWKWQTLDESYTCARGEMLAIVIDHSSGTVNGSNNSSFTAVWAFAGGGTVQGMPYAIQNDAGRTRLSGGIPIYGYASSSVTYGRPMTAVGATAYSSGSSPNEYGITFTLPAGWGATYKVVGVRWRGTGANSAGDSCTITLYDNDGDPGTALQQIVYDWDINQSQASAARVQQVFFDEATLSTLTFGNTYHIGFLADQASVAMSIQDITLGADAVAADRAGWPGGEQFALCTRAGGTWTEDTTRRPLIQLILDDITEPSSSGSGTRRMDRGMPGTV